jgi:hypothetical protein
MRPVLLTPKLDTVEFAPRISPKVAAAVLAVLHAPLRDVDVRRLMEGVGGGAGFVDTVERSLLDHFLTDPTYTPPTTMYLALSSTTPTEAAGNFTEPSGGSYARVSTVAADWSAAANTAPADKTNTAVKTFPAATADWSSGANQTHFGMYDASTAGNLLCWGALTTAKAILNGDTASFAASSLVLKLGDPGDTY